MYFYEVWVRAERYRGTAALTYSHGDKLAVGQIVRVPLQRQEVVAVVVRQVLRPSLKAIKQISAVIGLPLVPTSVLQLGEWLRQYYRTSVGAVAQTILPSSIPQRPSARFTAPGALLTPTLPPLTSEQSAAMRLFEGAGSYLLHGRTGSGKTRLYQELAERCLVHGESVLILSPEIGLTSQLADSFRIFGDNRVVVLHSGLTAAERFQAWWQIAATDEPLVVIGPRSALFAPLKKIGLIVMDESHEPAYKQEQEPRYHAARVAATLAKLHAATLVYGSATPLVSDYYLAAERQAPIIRLRSLAKPSSFTEKTTVVDSRDRADFSRSPMLSNQLLSSIESSLQHGEQSLLYLNRRGTARMALCQRCGWQALCPHCDLPLTFHADRHSLQCHTCGRNLPVPTSCPVCGSSELAFKGFGTKAVVDEIARRFPSSRVMRFDSDNTAAERLEKHYAALKRGDVDIVIGTQSIAKGLDLPRLSTLGVLMADSGLSLPDYTAVERTYQLISQVIGRVHRGHRPAHAIVQTFNPDSADLQAALQDDWQGFYDRELAHRQKYHFPPFRQLLVIRCRRASAASAERACLNVADHIRSLGVSVEIDGPAPAFHERSASGYTWQLIVKATDRRRLLSIVDQLPSTVTNYDLDPLNLL